MYKDLWITEHGSTMWNMFVPGKSDYDRTTVRIVPTELILKGHRIPQTWPQKHWIGKDSVEIDMSYIEIGHLVNLLISGNINYIWHVTSPIIVKDRMLLQELRNIVLDNPSRAPYHSIKGMAISQMKDELKRPRLSSGKGYRTAARTALFGAKLLTNWTIDFNVPKTLVNLDISRDQVETYISELDNAYDNSPFPDKPDEEPFREFLYDVRKQEEEGLC